MVTALSIAQGAIQNAAKDSANPYFNSSYADLASVRDAVQVPFSANGLSVMQLPSAEGSKVTITTILAHKSGEWVSSDLTMNAKDASPQAIGSAITYARRYALAAVAGVAPEDDDGEGAQGRDTSGKKDSRQRTEQKQKTTVQRQPLATMPSPEQPDEMLAPAGRLLTLGEFQKGGRTEKLDAFERIREQIGDEQYYRVLGVMGVEQATQFRSVGDAVKAYTEMLETFSALVRPAV